MNAVLTRTLQQAFLDALASVGYDVISASSLWNRVYKPELEKVTSGTHTYHIGQQTITFKKETR